MSLRNGHEKSANEEEPELKASGSFPHNSLPVIEKHHQYFHPGGGSSMAVTLLASSLPHPAPGKVGTLF